MRGNYSDGGQKLARKFAEIQQRGLLTALDMANPDPLGESGKVDWVSWLKTVLPSVDVFLPSFDEVLLMVDKPRYDELCARQNNPAGASNLEEIERLARLLIGFGAKIVALKLGDQGLYLQTAADLSDLSSRQKWTDFPWNDWSGVREYTPCYKVPVVGTTGSGDATVAGFLGALLKGLDPQSAVNAAAATGACNVTAADATSGVPSWEKILECVQTLPKRNGLC